jgi:hypothetical protein
MSGTSPDDRKQMIDILEKKMKELGIKSGIKESGEWGIKKFLAGGKTLFVCGGQKPLQKKLFPETKEELSKL